MAAVELGPELELAQREPRIVRLRQQVAHDSGVDEGLSLCRPFTLADEIARGKQVGRDREHRHDEQSAKREDHCDTEAESARRPRREAVPRVSLDRGHRGILYPRPLTVTITFGSDGSRLNLRPQTANMRVHQPRVAEVVVLPDAFEQLFPAQYDPGVLGELAQEAELRSSEGEVGSLTAHGPSVGDDLEVVDDVTVDAGIRGPHPSQKRSDPGRELLDLEGFGHVVVGPGLEAGNDVVRVRARGDDDDRDVTVLAQLPAELEPIHAGKHEIDERDLCRLPDEELQSFLGRGRLIDRVPLVLQREAQGTTDADVILDRQDASPHVAMMPELELSVRSPRREG